MSLTQAIDEAVDYVRTHPYQMTRGEVDEFQRLAERVYYLASRAGLVANLPQVPELQPELESNNPAFPPV